MTAIKGYFFVFIFICCQFISTAQKNKIDSLILRLEVDKEDTTRITDLNALGWEMMFQNPDTSITLGNQALALCEKLRTQHYSEYRILNFQSAVYGNMGVYYYMKSNYPLAL